MLPAPPAGGVITHGRSPPLPSDGVTPEGGSVCRLGWKPLLKSVDPLVLPLLDDPWLFHQLPQPLFCPLPSVDLPGVAPTTGVLGPVPLLNLSPLPGLLRAWLLPPACEFPTEPNKLPQSPYDRGDPLPGLPSPLILPGLLITDPGWSDPGLSVLSGRPDPRPGSAGFSPPEPGLLEFEPGPVVVVPSLELPLEPLRPGLKPPEPVGKGV